MKQFNPEEYLIFSCVSGSRLYGTETNDSDLDIRGVVLPPLEVLIDPIHNFKVADSFDGEDKQLYDLGNFIKLCCDNNPNILELLYCTKQSIITSSDIWDKIVENRDLFLSKNIKHRFLGYSISQLKSIIRHRGWFLNPPNKKPERKDFGLGYSPIVSEANLQNALAVPHELYLPKYKYELLAERLYREEKKKWDNYMQWVNNRNPKRKASEERFGYDGKMASHLFRLMTEGKELLLTGKITFPLPNAEWIKAIKDGFYKYEEILEMAKNMESEFETWYNESPLPHKPNINGIKELYFDIVRKSL